jgi:hypothetical protein
MQNSNQQISDSANNGNPITHRLYPYFGPAYLPGAERWFNARTHAISVVSVMRNPNRANSLSVDTTRANETARPALASSLFSPSRFFASNSANTEPPENPNQ